MPYSGWIRLCACFVHLWCKVGSVCDYVDADSKFLVIQLLMSLLVWDLIMVMFFWRGLVCIDGWCFIVSSCQSMHLHHELCFAFKSTQTHDFSLTVFWLTGHDVFIFMHFLLMSSKRCFWFERTLMYTGLIQWLKGPPFSSGLQFLS